MDYAKGIGILLVVLGHTNLIVDDKDKMGLFIIHFIYSFHMPLFFVVTGLLLGFRGRKLAEEDKKVKLSIGKLFLRLMVPYYIWSAIYIIAEYLQHGNKNEHIQTMIRSALITSGNAPLWFLASLFFTRLLFHFLKNYAELDEREILIGSMFMSIFASRVYMILTNRGMMEDQTVRFFTIALLRLLPSLFFIAFGYFLSGQLGKKNKQRDLCIGVLLSLSLFVCIKLYFPGVNMHTFKLNDMPYFLLTGCTGSTAVLLLCRCIPDGFKALRELGQDSMDIMALHYDPLPFMYIAGDFILDITGRKNIIPVWLLCCAMVIPLVLLMKLLKKEIADVLGKAKAEKSAKAASTEGTEQ